MEPILPRNEISNTEKFIWGMEQCNRGFLIAERLLTKDQTTHYLIMNNHRGDTMAQLRLVVLFKEYYSGKNPYLNIFTKQRKPWVVKKVIVITNESLKGCVKLFNSVDDIIIMNKEELESLSIYSKSIMCIHKNLHRDDYSWNSGFGWEPNFSRIVSGIKSYRWVLNLPPSEEGEEDLIKSSIRIDKESISSAVELLSAYCTTPEKAIIICPYAGTTSSIEPSDLAEFIRYLNENNYTVFTNVSKTEKELRGTFPLRVSVDVYTAMGVLGVPIIGAQSGILDVAKSIDKDLRIMNIFYCVTDHDRGYARFMTDSVERKLNTTFIHVEKNDFNKLSKTLIEYFHYYEKSFSQKRAFMQSGNGLQLDYKKDINTYFKEIKILQDYVIFLSVCDSADKYWRIFDSHKLGLRSDLSKGYRCSYIAVIDSGNVIYEKMNSNSAEISYEGVFNDISEGEFPIENYYYITSHGYGKGGYKKSAIVINGEQYSANCRGLNIVIYDKRNACVFDSVYVDMFGDEKLTIRRKADEIVTLLKPLQYVNEKKPSNFIMQHPDPTVREVEYKRKIESLKIENKKNYDIKNDFYQEIKRLQLETEELKDKLNTYKRMEDEYNKILDSKGWKIFNKIYNLKNVFGEEDKLWIT